MEKGMKIKLVAGAFLAGAFASLALAGMLLAQQSYAYKEDITVINIDGVPLSATVYYPCGFTPTGSYPAVIVSHGDGAMKEVMSLFSQELVKRGWIVVAYDYRNHGQSGNEPGSVGNVYDTEAIFDHVKNIIPQVNDSRIGLLGHSRGGLTSMQLSNLHAAEIAATVDIAGPAYNMVTLNTTQPRNLLVIAGDEDVNVPPYEALKILNDTTGGGNTPDLLYGSFSLGTARKLHWVDAGHTKILFMKETYVEAVEWFEMAFFGSVRYPVSTTYEAQIAVMAVTAGLGILCFFWAIFAVHHVLDAKKVIKHDTPARVEGEKSTGKKLLPLETLAFAAAIGGVSAGIILLLRIFDLEWGDILMFGTLVPTTYLVYYSIVPLLVIGGAALGFWGIRKVIMKQWSKRGKKWASKAYQTSVKGRGLTSAGLGAGFFLLLYAVIGIISFPLANTFLNPNRMFLFLYLALLLLVPNLACALLTFEGIQTKFPRRYFQDSWATLLLGILGRGIVIGALYLVNVLSTRTLHVGVMYLDTLMALILFMALNVFISTVSYHYFRSVIQEIVFNTLVIAWILTCLGNMVIF
nr:alpha/beta fold hydrolase [Candidatus Sigynarchaeum springense]